MGKRSSRLVLGAALVGSVLATLTLPSPAGAHPEQHGTSEGHLAGSGGYGALELVSKTVLTGQDDLIADVAVSPNRHYAYVANRGRASCTADLDKVGKKGPDGGAHVVDIRDPAAPQEIGFIGLSQGSRPGEGIQVVDITTARFSGTMLVMNNEQCGKNGSGGVSLYDVSDPTKPSKLAEHVGDGGTAGANDSHAAFAWDAGDKAYVVMADNVESTDVDILDITNPKRPRLIADLNLDTYFGFPIDQPSLGLQESHLHDMVVKQIDGRHVMLLAYWDGGYVRMDVTEPTHPTYIHDTEYAALDPQLLEATGAALPPEGNAHHAEFTADDHYFLGTDEDLAPYRSVFTIDSGPAAGEYPAAEVGFTPPVLTTLADKELNGPTVYGGYGCPGDRAGVPSAADAFPHGVQPGEERIVVFQRGPEQDPQAAGAACRDSEKIESGQLAGYDAVLIANHHTGAQGGGAADAPTCGGQEHDYTKTAPAVCIGHRALHLLFGDEPSYEVPYAGSEPATGAKGERASLTPVFDGWGYVHLFDTSTGEALDAYAVPEAHDESKAFGFGDLSVHEVATHPTRPRRAYLAYYSAGIRAIDISCPGGACQLTETGGYLDPNGSDFWGVEAFERHGQTYVVGSDRDSGLWIFRDARG